MQIGTYTDGLKITVKYMRNCPMTVMAATVIRYWLYEMIQRDFDYMSLLKTSLSCRQS